MEAYDQNMRALRLEAVLLDFDAMLAEPAVAPRPRAACPGAPKMAPHPAAGDLMTFLDAHNLHVGWIGWAGRQPPAKARDGFQVMQIYEGTSILSAEELLASPPQKEALLALIDRWEVPPEHVLLVSPHAALIESGREAGLVGIRLHRRAPRPQVLQPQAHTICDLSELAGVIRLGLPLPGGKISQ